jgi:uncharacterized protein (TIGR00255 family)
MLHSMTGYGKSSTIYQNKKITVEIKSLNSKSLDLFVRIPSIYKEKELEIRQIISSNLDRGKVEFSIVFEHLGAKKSVEINKELAKEYYADLKETNALLGSNTSDYLSLIVKMPDILIQSSDEVDEAEFAVLLELVNESCVLLNNFRRQEGVALENEFTARINEIKTLLEQVDLHEHKRIDLIKERMRKNLEELQGISGYDENRFQQELIFYIEKLDVSEEKMRLFNHLTYFLETMQLPSAGKKLGFITQEIGREINTLGSKSYHVELQKIVVEMKDNLEKIKEQVLNTL